MTTAPGTNLNSLLFHNFFDNFNSEIDGEDPCGNHTRLPTPVLLRGVVCVVVCVCVCVCVLYLLLGSYISPWGIHSPDSGPTQRECQSGPHRMKKKQTNKKINGEGTGIQLHYFVTV
jgi:hypothetical protein